jgi:nucleoside 2-deoxyribosyltransferase
MAFDGRRTSLVPSGATMGGMERAVYLASPLGFSEPGRHYASTVLVPRLAAEGWEVLDPWQDEHGVVAAALALPPGPERLAALTRMNAAIGGRNRRLLGRARAVLAVLDGPDIDSGTAAEIGWAAAKRVPVVGWRSDFRLSENEAATVNIQVEDFIAASGGCVVRSLDAALAALESLGTAAEPAGTAS